MPDLHGSIQRAIRWLTRAFFRRVEVAGLEHIPASGGGVLVSWHPNGLIDPALIFAYFPRRVIFGARDGLFRWPGLGWLLRAVGTIPMFRAADQPSMSAEARREANQESLGALARAVAEGDFSCLFPEGDSHDAPHLTRLRSGAARFYFQALDLQSGAPPVILPVGLHYDNKRRFRSNALVTFHPPLRIPGEVLETRDVAALTAAMHDALHDVVHATESWQLHHLLHRARALLRAEQAARAGAALGSPGMLERQVGYARVWAGYDLWTRTHPEEMHAIMERLAAYDADLRALGMEDHELDRAPEAARSKAVLWLLARVSLVYGLLPALLVAGAVINLLPMLLLRLGARAAAKRHKDEATIKLLGGVLLYPMAWGAAAVLVGRASEWAHATYPIVPRAPVLAAVVTVLLGVLGWMVALRFTRLVRETARAMSVRLTRARRRITIARLRVERDELCDALYALMEGVDLPGSVTAEGIVRASEEVPPGGRA